MGQLVPLQEGAAEQVRVEERRGGAVQLLNAADP
jgi:hypothetical protein